ncbi:MAG: DUF4435 domain-containing protein [Bacteroidota bacterium]|nr:DUF4435 domain-containing protein [Bacteroidota bacterium]MXW14599.1 DUF4435 domain-containing protein [Rhodothermaceae bacterium]MDE2644637.1 DUF4435 domain-containing protein [Bacteroidota bacterium]MXW33058.1 DUF4435 domain-containing protein [Rhodothermaceae bacterium]MYC04504.1 DUF4435 domain-containing protein [Rhodothermaceae bacterium]
MRRNPTIKANEIRLKRQSHKGCFLVVEGRDDRLFFKQFVACRDCKITVANGKVDVIEVVSILETGSFPGIIGVVDADFDHIEGNPSYGDNLIVHETVDLEALLIRSSALDRVLSEWGSAKKIATFGKDIRKTLVTSAVWIGCLRLVSHRNRLDLKLQGIRYSKFVVKQLLEIDIDRFVQEVLNHSQTPGLSKAEIVKELKSTHRSLENDWLVCYGKDMVEILAFGLRSTIGTNKAIDVASERIKRGLRLSFPRDDMENSKLGQDLHDWEERNPNFRVLKPN